MEADYGWEETTLNPFIIDLTGEDDDISIYDLRDDEEEQLEEINENGIDDIKVKIVTNVIEQYQTNLQQEKAKKRKKKKKSKATNDTSPIEKFSNLILAWPLDKLRMNNRQSLELFPLIATPKAFSYREGYYIFMQMIAIEETRVALFNGLDKPASILSLELLKFSEPCKRSKLVMATYNVISKGDIEYTRPGWCFSVKYGKTNDLFLACTVPMTPEKSQISLWIHCDNFVKHKDLFSSQSKWNAVALSSVITYQRVYCVCEDAPIAPFLSHLLQPKASMHIRFDDQSNPLEVPSIKSQDLETIDTSFKIIENEGFVDTISRIKKSSLLNTSQQLAMQECVDAICPKDGTSNSNLQLIMGPPGTSNLKLIMGPPGTGKTYFTVALLKELLIAGKKVILSTPSNKSLCVALEGFLKTYASRNFRIVLVGVEDKLDSCSTSSDSLQDQCYPTSLLPKQVVDATHSILYPQSAVDVLIYTLVERFHNAFQSLTMFIESLLDSYNQEVLRCKLFRSFQILNARHCYAVIQAILNEINNLVDKLYEYVGDIDNIDEVMSYHDDLHELFDEIEIDEVMIQDDYRKNVKLIQVLFESSRCLNGFCNFLQPYLKDKNSLTNEIIHQSHVIFCTLSMTGSSIMRRTTSAIDVLIIDEAGQALEAEVAITFGLHPSNLILIGDPHQLKATMLSFEAKKLQLDMSLMERLITRNAIPVKMLQTQYRMHSEISSYPNRAYYQQQLIDDNRNDTRILPLPLLFPKNQSDWLHECSRFAFIDLEGQEELGALGSCGNRSIRNPKEAQLVSQLINYLCLKSPCKLGIVSHISVITFYSGQVTCIQQTLQRSFPMMTFKVMTVDSFQGSECDIVILSFVRSNSNQSVGFIRDYQRLNVALTRAKHYLFAIGCVKTLSLCSELNNLVSDAIQRNRLFKSNILIRELSELIQERERNQITISSGYNDSHNSSSIKSSNRLNDHNGSDYRKITLISNNSNNHLKRDRSYYHSPNSNSPMMKRRR